jgi:hypothetical protein
MRAPRAGSGEPCRSLGEAVDALSAHDILSAVSRAGAAAPPLLWIHPGNVW